MDARNAPMVVFYPSLRRTIKITFSVNPKTYNSGKMLHSYEHKLVKSDFFLTGSNSSNSKSEGSIEMDVTSATPYNFLIFS